MDQRFQVHHIPRYSKILLRALLQPLLIYMALIGNFIMFLCAWAFHYFESGINPNVKSYFDAVWWAMTTVTTVGYGDIAPITFYGRLTGIVLMTSGILFFVGFTAVLASIMTALVERDFEDNTALIQKQLNQLSSKLDDLSAKFDRSK